MNAIFSGIKVLDLTKVYSGPLATRMLADYGASVIKIEHSDAPDDSRHYPPLKNGASGYFEILNRNKDGISLNLKDKKDLDHFYQLCKSADVIVENLTPNTKTRLHIDYPTVQKFNATIIYASLSGKGQDTDEKYYDIIAQAQSGLMSLSGTKDQPMKIGPAVVDAFCGMTLAFAISSALFFRQKYGVGQNIQVSMLGAAMNLLENNLVDYSVSKKIPPRNPLTDNAIAPFGVYKTKDGYMALAAGNNVLWKKLEIFLKEYTPLDDSLFTSNQLRLEHQIELTGVIEKVFSKFTSEKLDRELSKLSLPHSKVNSMQEIFENPQFIEAGYIQKVMHPRLGEIAVPGSCISFSASKKVVYKHAPTIEQDTTEYGS